MGFFKNQFKRETDLAKLKGTKNRDFGLLKRMTSVCSDLSARCDHSVNVNLQEDAIALRLITIFHTTDPFFAPTGSVKNFN